MKNRSSKTTRPPSSSRTSPSGHAGRSADGGHSGAPGRDSPRVDEHHETPIGGFAGKGGLQGLLSGLSSLLSNLGDLAEKGEQLKRSGQFTTKDGKDVAFHYGVSVRTAEGGREVRVEPFGNMKTGPDTRESPVKEVREPLTDVFEEDDHVLVVVEMPGIADADAQFELKGDVLTINAHTGTKRYRKELLLPADGLHLKKSSVRGNQGVFEVRLFR